MKVVADLLVPIGLLIAGGAISMSSQYLQRRWSRDDLLRSEERAAARKRREDAIEAVRAFLTVVRESEVREVTESSLDDAEQAGLFDSEEEWRRVSRLEETLKSYTLRYEVNPAVMLAKLNASTKEIEDATASGTRRLWCGCITLCWQRRVE